MISIEINICIPKKTLSYALRNIMSEKEDWNFVFDMMRTAHTNFKNKGEKSNIPFVDV